MTIGSPKHFNVTDKAREQAVAFAVLLGASFQSTKLANSVLRWEWASNHESIDCFCNVIPSEENGFEWESKDWFGAI